MTILDHLLTRRIVLLPATTEVPLSVLEAEVTPLHEVVVAAVRLCETRIPGSWLH